MSKIFCIGFNKTGTSSTVVVMEEFGYLIGNQGRQEYFLIKPYMDRNWEPIVRFCQSAVFFQDIPFSWPGTWQVLTATYPSAKFILTVRDSEEWYRSLTNYHRAMFANRKRIPTKEDLQNAYYHWVPMLDVLKSAYKVNEEDPYNKEHLINVYEKHNSDVRWAFRGRNNFLEIDVSHKDSYHTLCHFLGQRPLRDAYPHTNIFRG